MLTQPGPDFFVRPHECLEHVGPHAILHPRGRRRDEPLDVEPVAVDEEPYHRHLIVRFVGDVGQDDDPLLLDVGVNPRRQRAHRLALRTRERIRDGNAADRNQEKEHDRTRHHRVD